MRRHPIVAALLGLTLAACTGPHQRRKGSRAVQTAQIRAEVDRYVCAVWSEEAGQWGAEFLSETCRRGAEKAAYAAAIQRAVLRAAPIVVLGSAAYDHFYSTIGQRSRDEQEHADSLARSAYWSDPLLERGTWLSVCHEFRESGVSNDSCSTLPAPRPIQLSWDEFAPYLHAYVWPTQSANGSDVEIFVCSEVNGASDLPGAKELAQAGFLAAAGVAEDPELRGKIQGLAEKYGHAPADSSSLKRELEALLESPAGRNRACSALARTAWSTGVAVRDCPGS